MRKWIRWRGKRRCKIQFQIIFIHIFFIWIFRATTFPSLCIPFHYLPLYFSSLSGSFHYPYNLSLPSSTFCLNAFCILPVPVSFHPFWLPAIHLISTRLHYISASPPLHFYIFITFLNLFSEHKFYLYAFMLIVIQSQLHDFPLFHQYTSTTLTHFPVVSVIHTFFLPHKLQHRVEGYTTLQPYSYAYYSEEYSHFIYIFPKSTQIENVL